MGIGNSRAENDKFQMGISKNQTGIGNSHMGNVYSGLENAKFKMGKDKSHKKRY